MVITDDGTILVSRSDVIDHIVRQEDPGFVSQS